LQVASPDNDALTPDLDEPGEVLIDAVEEVDVFDPVVMRAISLVVVVAVDSLCGSLGDRDLFCFGAFRASRTWTSRCGSCGRSELEGAIVEATKVEGAIG